MMWDALLGLSLRAPLPDRNLSLREATEKRKENGQVEAE